MLNQNQMWLNLQLFAEGEVTQMGAETPATAQQDNTGEVGEGNTDADSTDTTAAEETAAPAGPYRVFQSKEDFQGYFDKTIGERLKDSRQAREKLSEYEPVIESLKKAWGVDNLDGILSKAEEQAISDLAYAKGVDTSVAQEMYRTQRDAADSKAQLDAIRATQSEVQQADLAKQLFSALDSELASLKEYDTGLYGDANAADLMGNQQFMQMLSAGLPIKTAYEALHVDKIKASALTQAQQKVVANIQARSSRPAEGAMSSGENAITKLDPKKLTPDQRADIRKRVSHGEKITF